MGNEFDEITLDMLNNMSDEDYNTVKNGGEASDDKQDLSDGLDADQLFSTDDENQDDDKIGDDDAIQEGVADKSEGADNDHNDSDGNSPDNIYASIALSLKDDGVLTLDDSDYEGISNADDLASVFSKQVNKLVDERLGESQKRIKEALESEVDVDVIKYYENSINNVNHITDDILKQETDESEKLRANVIYQDFINKGFSDDKAKKFVKKSFDAGTDVEDSMEAIKEIKDFLSTQYQSAISERKTEIEERLKSEREHVKNIETKIKDSEEPIKGVKLSKSDRQKLLQQFNTTVEKVDNKPLNQIAKYAKENPIDYQYNINLLFYLTNGFKDIGNVINKKVKEEKKSALSNIEKVLRNPNNSVGTGSLNFDNDKTPESKIGVNVMFD
jgi:hypothetical protein